VSLSIEKVSLIPTPDEQPLHVNKSKTAEASPFLRSDDELLDRFLSSRRVSDSTKTLYTCALATWSELGGVPLEDAGRDDLEDWFRHVDARGLMASTILTYATKLRALLAYSYVRRGAGKRMAAARAADVLDGVPEKDLRREMRRLELDLNMLLSLEELGALIRAAEHPRCRALIPVAYETACRKGELLGARVRDARIGDQYTELRVTGKTGLRVLPLVRSVPALEAWLEVHPDPRPGAPLFATVWRGEVRGMGEDTPNKLLDGLCGRAEIRHLHPHQLRHTRLTELAAAGVGEYVLKSFAGWTPDSKMAARYIHLSGRAHMRAILRTEGVDLDAARRTGPMGVAEVPGMLAMILEEAEG